MWDEARPREKSEPKGKEWGFLCSSPRTNSVGKGSPKGTSLSGEEHQLTCHAFKKGVCSEGNACDYWHPLDCSFQHKGRCKLWNECAFTHTEKAGGKPKKRSNSVAVVKALDITKAKGDFLHGVSAIPTRFTLQQVGKNKVKKFRLSRVAQHFVQEREKRAHTVGIIRQGGRSSQS